VSSNQPDLFSAGLKARSPGLEVRASTSRTSPIFRPPLKKIQKPHTRNRRMPHPAAIPAKTRATAHRLRHYKEKVLPERARSHAEARPTGVLRGGERPSEDGRYVTALRFPPVVCPAQK
jgi:hypothetical protein